MKPIIGSDSRNDEWRLYEFTRDSKIPLGYFGRRINVDAVVVGFCIIAAAIALILVAITGAL